MTKIKLISPFPIILGILTFSILSAYFHFHTNQSFISNAKNTELQFVSTLIQNNLIEQTQNAAARASLVVKNPATVAAMRTKNREELISRVLPAFLVQRSKYGVREAVFILNPAISFVRLFNLDTPGGEDLSSYLPIVVKAVKEKKAVQGVAIGRKGLSVLGIDLIEDDKGLIGTFELGMGFSPILQNIKKNADFEAGVFVDDDLMVKIATLTPRPEAERIIGKYQNVDATDWKKIRSIVTPALLDSIKEVSYKTESINGIDYGIVLVPLKDFEGKQIGSIVALGNFQSYTIKMQADLVSASIFGLLQAVFLIGLVTILFDSFFNPFEITQIPKSDPNKEEKK